jgi:hypothetical protein
MGCVLKKTMSPWSAADAGASNGRGSPNGDKDSGYRTQIIESKLAFEITPPPLTAWRPDRFDHEVDPGHFRPWASTGASRTGGILSG